MRLIDADELKAKLNTAVKKAVEDHYEYACAFKNAAQEWSAELLAVEDTIDDMPTVDAIPVAFMESEKQRVQGMIEESLKMGMIAESERLSLVMVILDHVVSNWYYNTGPEWRGEPNDTNRF